MEAARVCALRGHNVVLYEKEKKLGGQLRLAAIPPGRGEFLTFGGYLETQLKKLNVAVYLGVEASSLQVEAEKPDALVMATGGVALIPPLKGIDRAQCPLSLGCLDRESGHGP